MKSGKTPPLGLWLRGTLLGILIGMVVGTPCHARMGGGHAYSSGSSSGSYGGSSRSGAAGGYGGGGWSLPSPPSLAGGGHYGAYPPVGGQTENTTDRSTLLLEIVVLLLVVYVLVRLLSRDSFAGKGQTFKSQHRPYQGDLDRGLPDLRERDENFSKVLFLDFASLLFHKFYGYRGTADFRLVAPFLSRFINEATSSNTFYPQQRVHDIVIGQVKIIHITVKDPLEQILVEYEANHTVEYLQTQERVRMATIERWLLVRPLGTRSPEPGQMRTLSCPACGAPANFSDAGECGYCRSLVTGGERQWQVAKIDILSSEDFKPLDPAGYQQETGTQLPTVRQTDLADWQHIYASKQ